VEFEPNTLLNYVDVINYLGVLVDPHLTFEAHIDNIVQKAARRSYLFFKSFQPRSTELLVRAFTTYVRPLLQVISEVWSPHCSKTLYTLGGLKLFSGISSRSSVAASALWRFIKFVLLLLFFNFIALGSRDPEG